MILSKNKEFILNIKLKIYVKSKMLKKIKYVPKKIESIVLIVNRFFICGSIMMTSLVGEKIFIPP